MVDDSARCSACPFYVSAMAIADAVAAKLCPHGPPKDERLISPDEAAKRLGRSRTWLDRRRHRLPFVRLRDSGRGYDVVASALSAWIKDGAAMLVWLTLAT